MPMGDILISGSVNCHPGVGRPDTPERPVLTITQVYDLADVIGERYRALVLVGALIGSGVRLSAARRP